MVFWLDQWYVLWYFDRFLDSNGQLCIPEYFIPFGLGDRRCPGESLVNMEVFLFFTHIMHQLYVKPEGTSLNLVSDYKLIVQPKPFKVKIISREDWKTTIGKHVSHCDYWEKVKLWFCQLSTTYIKPWGYFLYQCITLHQRTCIYPVFCLLVKCLRKLSGFSEMIGEGWTWSNWIWIGKILWRIRVQILLQNFFFNLLMGLAELFIFWVPNCLKCVRCILS